MSITHTLALGASVTAIAAAGLAVSAGTSAEVGARHASATIVDVAGRQIGDATFVEDAAGRVHINVKVAGVSPGLHGLHVHAVGACTPNFGAAGGHHNPLGATHGDHAGDLPNLTVNHAGQGRLNAITTGFTLSAGALSVFDANGSAVILHALEDDYVTDPTGNSGGRIACGVIAVS